MAGFEQRDNSGILFKNDKKTKETQPDYKGSAMIDGKEYWMSSWFKTGKNGKFMSFAFELKKEGAENSKSSKKEEKYDDSDSMPF
jgi:hypothetical protein